MSVQNAIVLALLLAAMAGILTLLISLLKPWELFSKHTVIGQRNRYLIKRVYRQLNLKVFWVLDRLFITRVYMRNKAYMFKHLYVLEEDDAKVKAASLLGWDIFTAIVSMIFSLKYFDDTILSVIATIMMVMYVHQKIIGDGKKLLEETEDMLGDMVHLYNAEGRNIDRMFAKLMQDKTTYIYRYVEQMYTYLKRAILDGSDTTAISDYNRRVSSRHLRLIFNYLYITYRYGDEVSETGEYLFNRNMLAIQREVHTDLVKLQRIKDGTIGEQWFIIMAVAMIPAAKWYMNEFFSFDGFETISRFINSSFGYSIEIFCAVFALVCFYIYSKFMESNMVIEMHREIAWEELVVQRHSFVRRFIDFIAPKAGTVRYRKLLANIAIAERYPGVRPFYLRKLLICLIVSISVAMMLGVDTRISYMSITNDLYKGTNEEFMDTVISMQEDMAEYKERSISNDLLVIDILRERQDEYASITTKEERIGFIRTVIRDNNIDYGMYPEIAAERIYEKFILVDGINVSTIVLIVCLAGLCAYKVPNLVMRLNILLNRGTLIYDEVNGLYTVVMLLINHSASNIYMLMNWLKNFAVVFKGKLQTCVDNLGETEIKELSEGVGYKPLSRLVECILLAYRGADFKSAFAGIEQKHKFQEEARKIQVEDMVRKRIAYSELLSWGALGTTFCLYVVMPMLFSIADMLGQVA